jgi:predicted ATPase
MKLKKLTIENFRGIEHFEHDFTDELGRVRDLTVIVGPNGSGKTAILDAIWFGLKDILKYDLQRDRFRPEPQFIVRQGQSQAQVTYEFMFSSTFVDWIKEKWVSQGHPELHIPPEDLTMHVDWSYPDDSLTYKQTPFNQALFLMLSRPHRENNPLLSIGSGVYLFDQERAIETPPVDNISARNNDSIRQTLVNWGVKDKVIRKNNNRGNLYVRVQEAFNQICAPRKMGEVYTPSSTDEYFIEFFDSNNLPYTFDGLSSGERQVLNFLVRYFERKLSHAIVLIDEIETHLHPTWQQAMLNYLVRSGDNNQFIVTTHSPHIMMAASSSAIIERGNLNDVPDWQYDFIDETGS